MIRGAIIEIATNKIVTVVEYEDLPSNPPPGFEDGFIVVANEIVGPEWTWNGSMLSPPVPAVVPSSIPASISDRQFFQQLAILGTITPSEALAAVKVGTIPTVLQSFVDSITDPAQRFAANMLLAGATVFERDHPMSEAIGAAQGMTSDQIDAFFRAAAAL